MSDKSLFEKISDCIGATGRVGRPVTEDEIKVFNSIINKDNMFNYSDLDLADVRKMVRKDRAAELKGYVDFYVELAEKMGVKCIDTKSDTGITVGTEDGINVTKTESNDEKTETKGEKTEVKGKKIDLSFVAMMPTERKCRWVEKYTYIPRSNDANVVYTPKKTVEEELDYILEII